MGYVVEQKSQINSELGLVMPRLNSFAAALTGSESKAQALLKAARNHILSRVSKDRGHTPLALWAFTQTYSIWVSRMKGAPSDRPEAADPRLFQPRSRANDGGASARFAMQLAQLSPQRRATLHLVYGERLSYDEVAEIFGVPVATVITRLAKCHEALAQPDERAQLAPASPRAQGRAA